MGTILTRAARMSDLQYHIGQQINEAIEVLPKNKDGTILGQSYKPASATAQMQFGDTMVLLGDDGDSPVNHADLAIATTQPGDLYGPTGVERTVALATSTGYVLLFAHRDEDSPQVPAGERWILHKTFASQTQPAAVYDSGVKFANDGPTPGDGLGSAHLGVAGAHTTLDTKSGHQVALNDTAKTISTTTAGGMTGVYNDPSKTITHTALPGTFSEINGALQLITHQGAANVFTLINGAENLITHQAAPGVQTLIDGSGAGAISHVVGAGGTVALGALATAAHMFPAISKTDMSTMLGDASTGINIQRWVDLMFTMKAMLVAMTASGVPSLPTDAAIFAEMATIFGTTLPSFSSLSWSSIPVPNGSVVVSVLDHF